MAVFRHFSLKEIVGTLSKVSKRWWNISQTDGLWHTLPLDKWNICHLTEAKFLNIVSHFRAFSHFSMSKSEVAGLEVLILNDCLYIDENSFSESIIKQMGNINILSMNRTKLCSNEAVKLAVSLPSLFSLCVKGIPLSPVDIRVIVDKCKNLQLMEISHSSDERDDECRLLASECDVSVFIY